MNNDFIMDNSEAAFERPGSEDGKAVEKDKLIDQLYAQIGQLKVENDFLKKKNCGRCRGTGTAGDDRERA